MKRAGFFTYFYYYLEYLLIEIASTTIPVVSILILILILIMIRFLHDAISTKIYNEFRFSIDPIITTAASPTTPPVTDPAPDPDDAFYQQLRIGRAVLC